MKKITLFFAMMVVWAGHAQPHIQVVQDATGADFVQQSVAYHSSGRYVIAGTVKGRKILSKTHDANLEKKQLDVSSLSSGMYLLQVSSAEEVLFVKRVVKE